MFHLSYTSCSISFHVTSMLNPPVQSPPYSLQNNQTNQTSQIRKTKAQTN
jgi:hypothetical protein